jgi:hypothetical protein
LKNNVNVPLKINKQNKLLSCNILQEFSQKREKFYYRNAATFGTDPKAKFIKMNEEKGMGGLILFPVWGVIIGDHGEEYPHRHLVVAPVEAFRRNQPGNGRLIDTVDSKYVTKWNTLPVK